jgi:ParB family chromosome partitioning protein
MSEKKTGLGRGLTSLLGEDISVVTGFKKEEKNIKIIPVEKIQPGPWQARKNFNKADLEELSLSIKSKGILSPIWVSPSNENKSFYDLIAGERRWRAAQLSRIHEVPCIIFNNVDANSASVMSLIENIQRKDLNPIEEAKGYSDLINQHNYTQEDAGKIVGKSRVHITNSLRLLKLPEKVLNLLKESKLSAGHARLLIGRQDAYVVALRIINEALSVREVEKLFKAPIKKKQSSNSADPNITSISKKISDCLGLNVKINYNEKNQRSKTTILCNSLEQLNSLVEKLEKH